MFPIIGGRKVEHLLANIEALDIELSDEQMKELEGAVEFSLGFPGTMVVSLSYHHFSQEMLTAFPLGQRTRGGLAAAVCGGNREAVDVAAA